jgi:YfiH family protein
MISYGFTGRAEGDMRDNVRLIKYFKTQFPRIKAIVRPRQVHKDLIEIYDATAPTADIIQSFGDRDGVISRAKNTALTILTADCVPVVFADEQKGLIGASHQGWRGVLARLPQKMVRRMTEMGGRMEHITAAIGPSINACCYEVHQDRAILFRNEFPDSNAIINHGNHFFLNLTLLTYEQLTEAGITGDRIKHFINCTSCQTEKYFSFRKSEKKESFPEQISYVIQS